MTEISYLWLQGASLSHIIPSLSGTKAPSLGGMFAATKSMVSATVDGRIPALVDR